MHYLITEAQINRLDEVTSSLKFVRSLAVAAQGSRDCDIKAIDLLSYVDQVLRPLDAVSDEVQSAGPLRPETSVHGDSQLDALAEVPAATAGASATFAFDPLMWLLRALREGPAVLEDEAMVASIDQRMIEAKDFCPQWTEIHDYWRDTLDAHVAARPTAKGKSKARKLRRVA